MCNMFTCVHLSREVAVSYCDGWIGNRTIPHVNNNKTQSVDSFSETLHRHTCITLVHCNIDATDYIKYHE